MVQGQATQPLPQRASLRRTQTQGTAAPSLPAQRIPAQGTPAQGPPAQGAPAQGPSTAAQPRKEANYPPLVVEKLPDWVEHFAALREKLGHPPNARPFGEGIRFQPATGEEFRTIQCYLDELTRTKGVSWWGYSLKEERNLKLAIRGLPIETDPEQIKWALRGLGYPATYVKAIHGRAGRPGCLYFAEVARNEPSALPLESIWEVTELMYMPGVKVEPWRGKKGVAQCHRCQGFRHSSQNCRRPIRCVKCGEEHPAHECPRPVTDLPTCANCSGPHTANNVNCPVLKKETRNKKAGIASRTGFARPANQEAPDVQETAAASLMAPANDAPPRGTTTGTKKKRPRRKGRGASTAPQKTDPPAASATDSTQPQSQLLQTLEAIQQALNAAIAGAKVDPKTLRAAIQTNTNG